MFVCCFFFSKRQHFTRRGTLLTSRVNLYLNPLVLLTDLGWKAAACSSSSAIRYSFLDIFSWMTGALGLKFSLYCSGGFSWILFLFENKTMSHFWIENSTYEAKGFVFKTFILTTWKLQFQWAWASAGQPSTGFFLFSLCPSPSTWGLSTSFPSQLLCCNICWLKEILLISLGSQAVVLS